MFTFFMRMAELTKPPPGRTCSRAVWVKRVDIKLPHRFIFVCSSKMFICTAVKIIIIAGKMASSTSPVVFPFPPARPASCRHFLGAQTAHIECTHCRSEGFICDYLTNRGHLPALCFEACNAAPSCAEPGRYCGNSFEAGTFTVYR